MCSTITLSIYVIHFKLCIILYYKDTLFILELYGFVVYHSHHHTAHLRLAVLVELCHIVNTVTHLSLSQRHTRATLAR